MQQPELVVIDDGRIEGANRQLQRPSYLVDPRNALEADSVFFCVAHVDVCETFLHARLQNIRLCDFDMRRVWAHAVAVTVRGGRARRHDAGFMYGSSRRAVAL